MRAAPWVVAGIGLGVVAIACVVENVTPVAPPVPPRPLASAPAASALPAAAPPAVVPAEAAAPVVSPEASATEGGAAATEASSTTTTTSATSPSQSGPPDGDFYACQVDADCIAVHKVGCCNHGDKEAVNAQKAAAYAASFVCTERPICAQFIRRDTRVASCNASAHRCEMVRR